MASDEIVGGLLSFPAGADLSTKQFYAVKLDTTAAAARIVVCGAGDQAIGILYDKPNAAGVIGAVHPLDGRKCKGLAGSAGVTAGDYVAANSSGLLVTATKAYVDDTGTSATDAIEGSNVLGIATQTAVSGDIFTFVAIPLGLVPTTNR